VLLNVFLYFVLESHLIPVVVECHNGIDRVGEFRDKKEAENCVKDLLVRGIHGPISVEDRVTKRRGC
jgi:hypothetical protein